MPEIKAEELRPYQAAIVAQVDPEAAVTAEAVMKELKKILEIKVRDKGRKIVASGEASNPDSAFVRYEDRRQVPWAKTTILDKVNHLVVVLVKGNWVAIHCTESSRRDRITRALRRRELGPLMPARAGHLKAAFMKGHARTLWMRGTHRSTSYKADTKVLGGSDLAPALDPLGDQSYRYTAARCEPKNDQIGDVMGLAVDQSRLWVGRSEDWFEFEAVMGAVLDTLEETAGSSVEPLPVLAATQTDLQDVEGPYDIAIAPPEMLMMGPVMDSAEAAQLADMERLAFGTQFEVLAASENGLRARVLQQGTAIGEIDLEFREGEDEIEVIPSGTAQSGYHEEIQDIVQQLQEPEALTIYFESGHTIQSGQAFAVRHRDIPYTGWNWFAFGSSWEVAREKPAGGLAAIGTETSLFDWVLASWPQVTGSANGPGWLACDDRPGETADFLHIEEANGINVLTLIHVKGAKSAAAGRGIAVVPYETVAAQAIKNLRNLDAVLAAGELLGGTIPEGLEFACWHNGEGRARNDFIEQLDNLGTNIARRVAIVQPHVQRHLVEEVRHSPEHAQASRLRQLDTLLHGVAANCQSAGADLIVVGSE